MTKRMLIDATHAEETRVAVVDDGRLVEFDYESTFRRPLKGNIYLAKVTRVEPSLQAAFVNFGGNRHGFLPFSEIHPDYFRIPVADREALMAEQEAALRQAEEAEAREEAEDKKYALEAEMAEKNLSENIEEIEDDHETVEEIGGDLALGPKEDSEDETPAPKKGRKGARPSARALKAEQNKIEQVAAVLEDEPSSPEEADDHEINGNGNVKDQPSDDEEQNQEDRQDSTEDGGSEERQGANRFRRGRRGGRGNWSGSRGPRGSQDSSSRSERSGGNEGSDEQRFRFNLRRKYKIQEVIKRGQIMLVQVSKEERGNKGAAVTSYLSLPGRYCVLMPNSPRGGGVSRKISNYKDRAHMREVMKDLEVPKGMSVILRTAGVSRTKTEIKRDLDYLMRLWDNIRELTLESTAPALVYEEANLVKRAVRDLYTREIDEVHVAGEEGFKSARNFMKMLMPSHTKKVIEFKDQPAPLFSHYKIEGQIAEIGEIQVTLPSGGYLVINPTEALVSIDVNSGRATKERHIEETALKTNMEAAAEVARQLRLRDLGGLVVIDFIDMEDRRNNAKVERRMSEALSTDRARIQMGRISSFGLMELSRQRLSPSLTESQFEVCDHCHGVGRVRTADAASILVLRSIEDEGAKNRASEIMVYVPSAVALYILNYKRQNISDMETRYNFKVILCVDEALGASGFRIDMSAPALKDEDVATSDRDVEEEEAPRGRPEQRHHDRPEREKGEHEKQERGPRNHEEPEGRSRRRGRRGGRRRGGQDNRSTTAENAQDTQDSVSEHASEPVSQAQAPSVDIESSPTEPKAKAPRKSAVKESASGENVIESVPAAEIPPKDVSARRGSRKEKSIEPSESSNTKGEPKMAPTPKEYEVVNEAPAGPKKKGWWNKLIE